MLLKVPLMQPLKKQKRDKKPQLPIRFVKISFFNPCISSLTTYYQKLLNMGQINSIVKSKFILLTFTIKLKFKTYDYVKKEKKLYILDGESYYRILKFKIKICLIFFKKKK